MLGSRRFQDGFNRVNLHRPTESREAGRAAGPGGDASSTPSAGNTTAAVAARSARQRRNTRLIHASKLVGSALACPSGAGRSSGSSPAPGTYTIVSVVSLTGAKVEAWCLLIHADASHSGKLNVRILKALSVMIS